MAMIDYQTWIQQGKPGTPGLHVMNPYTGEYGYAGDFVNNVQTGYIPPEILAQYNNTSNTTSQSLTVPQANPGVAPVPFTGNLNTAQVVPGAAKTPNQIGVADYSGQVVTDPSLLVGPDMQLANQVPVVTPAQVASGTQPNTTPLNPTPLAVAQQGQAAPGVAAPVATSAAPVTTQSTQQAVTQASMTGAQGTLSAQAQIDPAAVQADLQATAAGTNPVGDALKQSAQQNISNIIDTSTLAGKLVADQLGEGNYTDAKATIKGQLDILQGEFFDPINNLPKIPAWAAGTARSVSRIAAFKGMTGTAATAALAQALMEASLPIAQEDAKFFQTITLENLNNRQEATINRANVLSKLDLANMDARLATAVNNSQAFLKIDMANLDNDQQAAIINTQSRVQSILEDAKSENAARLFVADSQNEKDMFYSQLGSSIEQFNASQKNAMEQFNSGEVNDISQFNAELENNREQFYREMQFAVDTANTKWRQTVTLTENGQRFEAAATDVKNMVGVSVEQLNQLWDRSDALLDYIWKTADNDADRNNQLALVKLQGDVTSKIEDQKGTGNILGTILGAAASSFFGWLF